MCPEILIWCDLQNIWHIGISWNTCLLVSTWLRFFPFLGCLDDNLSQVCWFFGCLVSIGNMNNKEVESLVFDVSMESNAIHLHTNAGYVLSWQEIPDQILNIFYSRTVILHHVSDVSLHISHLLNHSFTFWYFCLRCLLWTLRSSIAASTPWWSSGGSGTTPSWFWRWKHSNR